MTSLLYGAADFLGGEGAKRAPTASVVLWAGVISWPLLAVTALIVGGRPRAFDIVIGALAGISGAFGLLMLFAGLSRGLAAVVAPASAAMGAGFPVIVGVLEGETQQAAEWAGIALAIPAIFLCSWAAQGVRVRVGGLLFGLAAGLGFGGFAVLIRLTDPASNLMPLIASRAATMAVAIVIGGVGVWKIVGFSSVPRGIVIANGVFDVTANVTFLLALRAGSLALAAVAASFYPAVTVLLARAVNREHLHSRQLVGVGMTLVSLGLIAAG